MNCTETGVCEFNTRLCDIKLNILFIPKISSSTLKSLSIPENILKNGHFILELFDKGHSRFFDSVLRILQPDPCLSIHFEKVFILRIGGAGGIVIVPASHWLRWVRPALVAVCRILTAAASLVAAKGSRAWAQWAVQRFNRPAACEVFPDQESNPHLLHRQAAAFPLSHVHSSPSTHCEVTRGPWPFQGPVQDTPPLTGGWSRVSSQSSISRHPSCGRRPIARSVLCIKPRITAHLAVYSGQPERGLPLLLWKGHPWNCLVGRSKHLSSAHTFPINPTLSGKNALIAAEWEHRACLSRGERSERQRVVGPPEKLQGPQRQGFFFRLSLLFWVPDSTGELENSLHGERPGRPRLSSLC